MAEATTKWTFFGDSSGAVNALKAMKSEAEASFAAIGKAATSGLGKSTDAMRAYRKDQVQQGRFVGFYVRELSEFAGASAEAQKSMMGLGNVIAETAGALGNIKNPVGWILVAAEAAKLAASVWNGHDEKVKKAAEASQVYATEWGKRIEGLKDKARELFNLLHGKGAPDTSAQSATDAEAMLARRREQIARLERDEASFKVGQTGQVNGGPDWGPWIQRSKDLAERRKMLTEGVNPEDPTKQNHTPSLAMLEDQARAARAVATGEADKARREREDADRELDTKRVAAESATQTRLTTIERNAEEERKAIRAHFHQDTKTFDAGWDQARMDKALGIVDAKSSADAKAARLALSSELTAIRLDSAAIGASGEQKIEIEYQKALALIRKDSLSQEAELQAARRAQARHTRDHNIEAYRVEQAAKRALESLPGMIASGVAEEVPPEVVAKKSGVLVTEENARAAQRRVGYIQHAIQDATQFGATMGSVVGAAFSIIGNRAMTAGQKIAAFLSQLVQAFAQVATSILTVTAMQTAQNSVTQQGTAIDATAAAVKAGKSAADIPGIGWLIAIPAAAAVLTGLLGMVASAEGGWDVPGDRSSYRAVLHPREMVLPAHIAQPLRSALADGSLGGGSGGGTVNHYTINTLDALSFETYLRRNQGALFKVQAEGARNGRG